MKVKAMATDATDVYLVGFDGWDLGKWSQTYGLNPHRLKWDELEMLPEETPVLSHADDGARLNRSLDNAGKANPIILYVPSGQQIPRGAYYDVKVGDADLPGLRDMLAHPELFRVSVLADSVPLRLLTGPLEAVNVRALGLPAEDAAHIAECDRCLPALINALRDRVAAYQLISCPVPDVLVAFALQDVDPGGEVTNHIESCPLCKSQVEALRQAFALPPLWVRSTLNSRLAAAFERVVELIGDKLTSDTGQVVELWRRLRTSFGPSLSLFLQLSESEATRSSRGARSLEGLQLWLAQTADPAGLEVEKERILEQLDALENLLTSGLPLDKLVVGKGHIRVGWDATAALPYLELKDRFGTKLKAFRIELRRAGRPVWSAEDIRSDGRLLFNPVDIEEAMNKDEAVHGPAEDGEYSLSILEG